MKLVFVVLLALLVGTQTGRVSAASLQVAPVSVEVQAPNATATVTIRNEGDRPLSAQVRVFRWAIVDGAEQLIPTEDIIASPPIVLLTPKADYTVRIVRTVKSDIGREESYRLLIDEVPDSIRKPNSGVNIVVRYSIPVFFVQATNKRADLAWSIERTATRYHLVVRNQGDRRSRIANLKIRDASGKIISFGTGLSGYALAKSTTRWPFPRGTQPQNLSGEISVSAETDSGAINARVSVQRTN